MRHSDGLPDIPRHLSPTRSKRATRARQQAADELFEYALDAWKESLIEQIDTMASREAHEFSGEQEVEMLNGLVLVAGSGQAAQQMIAKKISNFSNSNNARLRRRFQ